ncbi:2-amino-4-hydroxy-6-hydroxymethyldihydropteridine diphosphokinase [Flavobacterium noncentrifugens]|uniref:2-amino-4-hydroxy-6-hydroxymethyldihydropteridine pyrophosphokinase n=1 Tax=Flavobacterium noncentrifugens TaxID=1128970 RepID=A0A1G8RSV0_9FLAO|nr:2-amino-4-hydroxy-6-hydroxymethyldihydropteridine diphosphokinase [Flavobacterium noncentrifugens]GEP49566.1 2-amino-4-hydroxy-6-hydroxymethyldihydropteridine diphosphokinase [Flavobacterium noncentrifugens]SDJ20048.1 2-amino-4-hydroxy-6-hydroxymethyldihydropteridinediphosphokinase [Flavobacterium noncentrifugens]
MSRQHQVILAIGSNQGDRLENIQAAVECIHNEVGTVVKISKLYETPSWGFESDSFYNCALMIHTDQSAHEILEKSLEAEKKLGRIRYEADGYQQRIIDIDVIAFDEDIIETENLTVPHPLMQERMFVLLPMRDLNLDWRHPILQKYLPELLKASEDKSNCKVVQELDFPLQKVGIEKVNHIAIEGNIGAGKTTLANKIAEDFNAKTVLERFADNPFLPMFYEDQNRYAFPLEMSFLADRYQQISDDLAQFDLFKDFIIADYHIFKSLIFAKVTLTDDEYRLYRKLFEIIYKEMPKPDLYIYLYQNTDRLLENIRRRGRSYEQEIPAEYLDKINKGYLDYIKSQTDLNVLIIDVSEKDFVKNQSDYAFILEEIRKKLN